MSSRQTAGSARRHRPATVRLTAVRLAAVTVAAVLALTMTGAAVGPAAGDPPAPTPPTGVPPAGQPNLSPYPVLQRLGRWNGTTFEPVAPASIAAGHAIFISHGWSPDYLPTYERLQADRPTLVTAWTPGLVNAAGQSLMTDLGPLAAAIQRADPGAAVVMFSWVDQSATTSDLLDVRGPEEATEVNGHRLAVAIDEALAPDFAAQGGQVHLIGHSFGANIVTTAALALATPPRQLTLLDSPEVELARFGGAKNDLQYTLPRLDIGRGPGQTFVDNYISLVGERYATRPGLAEVVDVRTAPPKGSPGDQHSFAIVWYTGSVEADASAPAVGYRWSPLVGADDLDLGSSYVQQDVAAPLDLTETEGPPPAGVDQALLVGDTPLRRTDRGSAGGERPPEPAATVALGRDTAVANLTFTTDADSLWLDFDASLAGRAGDLLSLFVDGRERYQAGVPAEGTGDDGSFVILYDVEPGPHVLSVAIGGPVAGEPAGDVTTARLANLRLATLGGIERNLTAAETRGLIAGGVVTALLVVGVLAGLAATAVLVVLLLRRRRRLRRGGSPDVTDADAPDQAALSRTADDPAGSA